AVDLSAGGAARGDLIAAVAAQVIEAVLRRGAVACIEVRLLGGADARPLQRHAGRAVGGEHHTAARARALPGLSRRRTGLTGGRAARTGRHARERAGRIPVGGGGDGQIAGAVGEERVRRQSPGPVGRIVVAEVGLRSVLDLRGLLLVDRGRACRLRHRRRLEAEDLVNVRGATGRACEPEAYGRGYGAVGCADALILDDVRPGPAVVAVVQGQQAILGQPQAVGDRRGALPGVATGGVFLG